MILQSVIETCYNEQQRLMSQLDTGWPRGLLGQIQLSPQFITIITGIRRCGKSTLMTQLMKDRPNELAYFNFEDPRIFGFSLDDFDKLAKVIGDKQYFFFDEIQNIDRWELYIRRLHDSQKTICITGSNASLLSRELGTRLTGRHISHELFPFNYGEFIAFQNYQRNETSLKHYMDFGGFPDALSADSTPYLHQLFRDILYRDIVVRYGVRNAKTVEEIALFLISNVGKPYSLNGLKKTFGVGSASSVSEYVGWFEDCYLLFSLPRFSWSLRSIAVNPKKVYCIDTGLARANSLSFSRDKGRILENAVYLKLRSMYHQLYYFSENGECDFIVKEHDKITHAIQVCYELHSDNMKRETAGLLEAMDQFNLSEGVIITNNQRDVFRFEQGTIHVVPAWDWL